LLTSDATGMVPHADVVCDVGEDNGGGTASGRFLAHRIVLSAQSCVLMAELEKSHPVTLEKWGIQASILRIDPRISKEVWRSALQFMYTGAIHCRFTEDIDKVVELLRACALYMLPGPLVDFAQACLYPLLPKSPPQIALQVFSICAGTTAAEMDLAPAREASTYILLRSAHTLFEDMEAVQSCQILERLVQAVERKVLEADVPTVTKNSARATPDQQSGSLPYSGRSAHMNHQPGSKMWDPYYVNVQDTQGRVSPDPQSASVPGPGQGGYMNPNLGNHMWDPRSAVADWQGGQQWPKQQNPRDHGQPHVWAGQCRHKGQASSWQNQHCMQARAW